MAFTELNSLDGLDILYEARSALRSQYITLSKEDITSRLDLCESYKDSMIGAYNTLNSMSETINQFYDILHESGLKKYDNKSSLDNLESKLNPLIDNLNTIVGDLDSSKSTKALNAAVDDFNFYLGGFRDDDNHYESFRHLDTCIETFKSEAYGRKFNVDVFYKFIDGARDFMKDNPASEYKFNSSSYYIKLELVDPTIYDNIIGMYNAIKSKFSRKKAEKLDPEFKKS